MKLFCWNTFVNDIMIKENDVHTPFLSIGALFFLYQIALQMEKVTQ